MKYVGYNMSEAELFLNRYDNSHTRAMYKYSLTKLHDFMLANGLLTPDSVDLVMGEVFKASLEANHSPKTAQSTMDVVKEFFNYLQARGVIHHNEISLVKSTKVSVRDQKTEFITPDELLRMLKIARQSSDYTAKSNHVMLLLLFNAGLRESELANLKLSDLFLQSGHYIVRVNGKGMRQRFISLSAKVTLELSKLFESLGLDQADYIIQGRDRAGNYKPNKPISRATIFNRVRALALAAGINKNISPDSIRRGCATHLYKIGTPIEVIQRILGHNSPTVTSRYLDKEIDKQVSAKHALEFVGEVGT